MPVVGQSDIPRVFISRHPSIATHPEPSRGVTSVYPDISEHPPPYIAYLQFFDLAPVDIGGV